MINLDTSGIGASLFGSEHAHCLRHLGFFFSQFLRAHCIRHLGFSSNSSSQCLQFSIMNQYRYTRFLLGGRTSLSGIANSSCWVDCIRNQYHRVCRVTARWAYDLHDITNNSLRVDTSIARYC